MECNSSGSIKEPPSEDPEGPPFHKPRAKAMDMAAEALMVMADALREEDQTLEADSAQSNSREGSCCEEAKDLIKKLSGSGLGFEEARDTTLDESELCFLEDGKKIEQIIANKSSLDTVDDEGLTSLQRAALRGHMAYVQLLLSMGACPNRTGGGDGRGSSRRGGGGGARRLQRHESAFLHESSFLPPVALALNAGHVEIAEALFSAGVRADWQKVVESGCSERLVPPNQASNQKR
jgi:ankyrin repeat protein